LSDTLRRIDLPPDIVVWAQESPGPANRKARCSRRPKFRAARFDDFCLIPSPQNGSPAFASTDGSYLSVDK
jgi:hypothetical protein